MQKEGKKMTVTVYYEEKITIDHKRVTLRRSHIEESIGTSDASHRLSNEICGDKGQDPADGDDGASPQD